LLAKENPHRPPSTVSVVLEVLSSFLFLDGNGAISLTPSLFCFFLSTRFFWKGFSGTLSLLRIFPDVDRRVYLFFIISGASYCSCHHSALSFSRGFVYCRTYPVTSIYDGQKVPPSLRCRLSASFFLRLACYYSGPPSRGIISPFFLRLSFFASPPGFVMFFFAVATLYVVLLFATVFGGLYPFRPDPSLIPCTPGVPSPPCDLTLL